MNKHVVQQKKQYFNIFISVLLTTLAPPGENNVFVCVV